MNKLEDLIKKLCPNGVKYFLLEQLENENIITLGRGNVISKTEIKEKPGEYPVYSSSSIGDGEIGRYGKYMFDDERITWSIDGGGKFFYRNNLKYSVTNVSGWLKVNKEEVIITKYLYYFLINEWKNKTYNYTHKAHPSVIRKEYRIAVPPLEVQREIVCILDKFVNYNELLDSEFKKRKKQLEFVMQEELKVKNFNKFCTIGELCKIEKGKTPLQKAVSGKYPLVATTENLQSSDKYQFDCEAVCMPLISSRGHGVASITRIFYQQGKFALGNILCAIIPKNNKIKAEFLRHYLYYNKDFLLVPLMTGGANVSLTIDSLKNVKVPVTSLENQNRIIKKINTLYKILDKKNGLPAEIELRQKQYEYYRDKLLTFKELKIC